MNKGKHILTISEHAKSTPSKTVPDGAITGNGDVTVCLGGASDRVHLYIAKADFWKADGNVYAKGMEFVQAVDLGGFAPLGPIEILLPHLAYADYKVEQNLDEAYIRLSLTEKTFSANIKFTVCATENTVIIELDRTFPSVSVSLSFLPIEHPDAITYKDVAGDVAYSVRGFDTPGCRYPNYGICAIKQVSRKIVDGREHIVWAMSVCTNHDNAAYKVQAIERARIFDEDECTRLLRKHKEWWKDFWSKSSVELSDKQLETYWYAGLYAIACCTRNKKFPPGLWGAFSTADGMRWFGDYHLNYNFEAPFYAVTSSNHTELLECYSTPLNDFLPIAKYYAKEFLGIKGAYFPVAIGPYGLETDYRPNTKEHGHLFLGQKSNAGYAAVIPMMHWYSTRDKDFAKREYYDFLFSVAEFWENYLVFEDGEYQIYNDSLNEEAWCIPERMPKRHDNKNPAISCGLVKMVMRMIIDISTELSVNTEKIPKWQHILENMHTPEIFEMDGKRVLRGFEGCEQVMEVSIEYMYPIGEVGKYGTPEMFEALRNSHKHLKLWESGNRFCSYYPMAARLELPYEEIVSHIHDNIEKHGHPNGLFDFGGGGLENCTAVPATVNEMLLQSYEGIIRLFPVWDRKDNVRFDNLRAKGAFLVSASLQNGNIYAEIFSEKGMPLTVEAPDSGYILVMADGQSLPITERFITVNPQKGDTVILKKTDR